MNAFLDAIGSALPAFGWAALAVLAVMTGLWLVSLPLRNASIVDIAWGPLFAVQALVYAAAAPGGWAPRTLLLTGLVVLWALRLATHVAVRNAGHGEDFRYAGWRRNRGRSWWWRSFLQVFALQGALALVIGVPLLAVNLGGPQGWTPLDAAGVALWLIGFVFEAGGDWQLTRFRADPANRGRTLRSGLWALTRHPNYFGDAAQWWGWWLIAAAAGGWWSLIGPALMTLLLVRVSGVGLLERTIAERRPDYAEYMATTSAFIPWFPRHRTERSAQ